MTTHEATVTLEHEPESHDILLGYSIGSAELKDGSKLTVVGSGKTVRFTVSGSSGHVDLDLSGVAAKAVALLKGDE